MICGQLEIEIMNAVWKLQNEDDNVNISIADVVAELSGNNVKRAYTTIKTVMDRLVTKAVLVRYKSGKKFYYTSAVDKDEACKHAIDNISNNFFEGNYVKLIHFIEKQYDAVLV